MSVSYLDVVESFESVNNRLNNALGEYMQAAGGDLARAFSESWRVEVRELARGMLQCPDIILSQPAPPEFATLYALYQQWAPRYRELAYRLLDIVSALDHQDSIAAAELIDEVGTATRLVFALTEARYIYIGGLYEHPKT